MDESDLLLMFPIFGVTIGSLFGTMDNIIPFGFTFGMFIFLFLCVWKGVSLVAFSFLGMAWGSVIGAMGNVVPFDFVTLTWVGVFMVQLLDDAGVPQGGRINSTRLFILPLVLLTIGGVINTAAPDFAVTNSTSSFATGWNGCVTTCNIASGGLSTLFGSTLFFPLTTSPPNLCCSTASFIGGLFGSLNGITSVLSAAVGIVLILLGLGVGGTVSVLVASFGININDAGARLCQALGFAMVLYSVTNLVFGSWVPGLFGPTWELGTLLTLVFPAVCFYGAYLRATIISE